MRKYGKANGGGASHLSRYNKVLDTLGSKNYNLHTQNYSLRKGFTLAEVLITLGIIGIVAALTIPTLVSNYQKRVTATELKQAYSVFYQVLEHSEIDNGPINTWKIVENPSDSATMQSIYLRKKYIEPYFKNIKYVRYDKYDNVVYNAAGATLGSCFPNWDIDNSCTSRGWCFWLCKHPAQATSINNLNYLYLLVDLNGIKKPNRTGRDIFYFAINKNKASGQALINGYVFGINKNSTESQLLDKCNSTDTSSWLNGSACTELIMRNNWKIPEKDYPW